MNLSAWLSALTVRGKAFLAGGIAAFLLASAIGQRDLLRVALLLLALPVFSLLSVLRSRVRLSARRSIEPHRVPVGRPATVKLALANLARMPSGVLLVQDELPYALGSRPRFVIDDVWSRWHREVTYAVRSDSRGHYTVGPLSVRVTDPFGLVELRRSFTATETLVVTPEVFPLPNVRLPGEWSGSGETRPRSIASAGEDDVTVRSYALGDDMRRVHWRATAHHGALMVRREEQPWQSRCSLLLDTRVAGHAGQGPQSSFEWAVRAAASISTHLLARGYALRLVTGQGGVVSGTWHDVSTGPGAAEGVILDALAVAATSTGSSVARFPATLAGAESASGLIVGVFGHLSAAEAEQVVRVRTGGTPAIAVVLDVTSWTGVDGRRAAERDEAVARLHNAGWRVTTAVRDEPVAQVWQRLAVGASAVTSPTTATVDGAA